MAAGTAARDIRLAASGMAAIRQQAQSEQDAATLTYVALYACGYSGAGRELAPYRALGGFLRDEYFVARLRHDVAETVDITDWEVTGHDGGRVLLKKDGIRAFIDRCHLAQDAEVGEHAAFPGSPLRTGLMPGFVARAGRLPLVERSQISRFYLNIRPTAAAWALGPLARRLDAEGLPYEMKVLAHPKAYARRDACVLYVGSDAEAVVAGLLQRALEESGTAALRRPAPRLTGRIAPGVALAHDPTDIAASGLSHGQWVAGLFDQAVQHTNEPREIARHVRRLIVDAGRDPAHPHLRGSGPKGEPT